MIHVVHVNIQLNLHMQSLRERCDAPSWQQNSFQFPTLRTWNTILLPPASFQQVNGIYNGKWSTNLNQSLKHMHIREVCWYQSQVWPSWMKAVFFKILSNRAKLLLCLRRGSVFYLVSVISLPNCAPPSKIIPFPCFITQVMAVLSRVSESCSRPIGSDSHTLCLCHTIWFFSFFFFSKKHCQTFSLKKSPQWKWCKGNQPGIAGVPSISLLCRRDGRKAPFSPQARRQHIIEAKC